MRPISFECYYISGPLYFMSSIKMRNDSINGRGTVPTGFVHTQGNPLLENELFHPRRRKKERISLIRAPLEVLSNALKKKKKVCEGYEN